MIKKRLFPTVYEAASINGEDRAESTIESGNSPERIYASQCLKVLTKVAVGQSANRMMG